MQYAPLVALLVIASAAQASSITDLTQWTLLEDPPHPGLSATIDSPSQATLSASGAIPSGTDIGYASVNGPDVASSTSGFAFDPASDFEIAIDYDLNVFGLVGAVGFGLGIGEDVAGANSAGIGLGFQLPSGGRGFFVVPGAASRTNDVDEPVQFFTRRVFQQGRLFVAYDAASGDVTVGVNPTPGSAAPSETRVLAAVQEGWTDAPLLASFFLRSRELTPIFSGIAGDGGVVFSNFTVLRGTPVSIPEPTTAFLVSLALVASWRFPRTR